MDQSFQEDTASAEGPSVSLAPALRPQGLSEMERSVVGLSRWDPPSSLDDVGSWRRAAARLLGAKPHNTLADPDLENLRRYAVHVRLQREGRRSSGVLPEIEMATAKAAEIEGVIASWEDEGGNGVRWIGPALLIALAIAGYSAISASLGDRLVALVVVGLLLVVTAPILLPTSRR
jgi:hypothetical protein